MMVPEAARLCLATPDSPNEIPVGDRGIRGPVACGIDEEKQQAGGQLRRVDRAGRLFEGESRHGHTDQLHSRPRI
jgi:hypothetical protein